MRRMSRARRERVRRSCTRGSWSSRRFITGTITAPTSARSLGTTGCRTATWTCGRTVKPRVGSSMSRRARGVLTAVILVKSSREALTDLGPRLADVPGVAEVYTVTGEWDFVAIVRVREHEELAEVV